MKKCVRCRKRFDDSALKCPDCQLYLIKDTVGDMALNHSTIQTNERTAILDTESPVQKSISASSLSTSDNLRPQRGRVLPVDEEPETDTPSPGLRGNGNGFRPSGETTRAPINTHADSGYSGRQRTRRRDMRRLLRSIIPVLRYAIPAVLVLLSILFIVLHWDVVYGVIQSCIIGGFVGGILLTWISAGHHYTPEATMVGVIGGMIVSCVLTYNLFNVAYEMEALFIALVPIILIIVALRFLIRGRR